MQALGNRLPDAGAGLISIIVPVWNQHKMTEECLDAIVRCTRSEYELIVVDNGSSPPIKLLGKHWLEATSFGDLHKTYVGKQNARPAKVIRNEENLGFPAAVNQGVLASAGEVVALLNNDVIVTPGWDKAIVGHLDKYSIVGPTTNFSSGLQRIGIPVYSTAEEMEKNAGEWTSRRAGKAQEVKWVIGFLFAFRRSLYEEIGKFDESLWPNSGEEIDFCYRARKAGHRVGIAHDVYVHHHGSVTFEAMEREGIINYEEVIKASNNLLKEKYGDKAWKQEISETKESRGTRLNLGCGHRKIEGYINIDNREEVSPDLCCDLTLRFPFQDDSVDEVRAYDFLEHIPAGKTVAVVEEIWRVLKPGGLFESCTPDAERGQGAFQDPFHVSFWVENTWLYFSHPSYRAIYGIKADFEVEQINRVETDRHGRVSHLHVVARKR